MLYKNLFQLYPDNFQFMLSDKLRSIDYIDYIINWEVPLYFDEF